MRRDFTVQNQTIRSGVTSGQQFQILWMLAQQKNHLDRYNSGMVGLIKVWSKDFLRTVVHCTSGPVHHMRNCLVTVFPSRDKYSANTNALPINIFCQYQVGGALDKYHANTNALPIQMQPILRRGAGEKKATRNHFLNLLHTVCANLKNMVHRHSYKFYTIQIQSHCIDKYYYDRYKCSHSKWVHMQHLITSLSQHHLWFSSKCQNIGKTYDAHLLTLKIIPRFMVDITSL